MTRLLSVCLLLAIAATSGCCRACCWRNGGTWSNGSCYVPQPVSAVAPTVQTVVPTQTYAPASVPCTCAPVQ